MTAASLGLTDHQYANLLSIVAAVKARGWPIKAAYIATAGGLAEAGLRMLASANVPKSQQYPNDGLGYDHASMNFFQQQTGYAWAPANEGLYQPNATMQMSTMDSPNGWGTPAELMNAETATSKFLDALSQHPWQSMTNWAAAQAVQHSAYADGSNYRAQDARAQQLVNAVWNTQEEDEMTKAEMQALLIATVGKWLATVLYGDVDAKTGASANNGGATGPNSHPVNLTAALYRIEQLEKKVGA